jgi:hypothetical protein
VSRRAETLQISAVILRAEKSLFASVISRRVVIAGCLYWRCRYGCGTGAEGEGFPLFSCWSRALHMVLLAPEGVKGRRGTEMISISTFDGLLVNSILETYLRRSINSCSTYAFECQYCRQCVPRRAGMQGQWTRAGPVPGRTLFYY